MTKAYSSTDTTSKAFYDLLHRDGVKDQEIDGSTLAQTPAKKSGNGQPAPTTPPAGTDGKVGSQEIFSFVFTHFQKYGQAVRDHFKKMGLELSWLQADGEISDEKRHALFKQFNGDGPRSLGAMAKKHIQVDLKTIESDPMGQTQVGLLKALDELPEFQLLSLKDQESVLKNYLKQNNFSDAGATQLCDQLKKTALSARAQNTTLDKKVAIAAVVEARNLRDQAVNKTQRGDAKAGTELLNQAETLYRAAIEVDPSNHDARLDLAEILIDRGEDLEGRVQLQKGLESYTGASAKTQLQRFHGLLKQSDRPDLLKPEENAWVLMGQALLKGGKHGAAALAFESAVTEATNAGDRTAREKYLNLQHLAEEKIEGRKFHIEFAGKNPLADAIFTELKGQGVATFWLDSVDPELTKSLGDKAQGDRKISAEELFAYIGRNMGDKRVRHALKLAGVELPKGAEGGIQQEGFAKFMAKHFASVAKKNMAEAKKLPQEDPRRAAYLEKVKKNLGYAHHLEPNNVEVGREIQGICQSFREQLKLKAGTYPTAGQIETAKFLVDFSALLKNDLALVKDLETWKHLLDILPDDVLPAETQLDHYCQIMKHWSGMRERAQTEAKRENPDFSAGLSPMDIREKMKGVGLGLWSVAANSTLDSKDAQQLLHTYIDRLTDGDEKALLKYLSPRGLQQFVIDTAQKELPKDFEAKTNGTAFSLHMALRAQGIPDAVIDRQTVGAGAGVLDPQDVFDYIGQNFKDPQVQAALKMTGLPLPKDTEQQLREKSFGLVMADHLKAEAEKIRIDDATAKKIAPENHGWFHVSEENGDAAANLFLAAAQFDPKNPARYDTLFDFFMERPHGKPAALNFLKAAIQLEPTFRRETRMSISRPDVLVLSEDVAQLVNAGKLEEAKVLLQEAALCLEIIGETLPQKTGTIDFLGDLAKVSSKLGEVNGKLGNKAEAKKFNQRAVEKYQEAIDSDPTSPKGIRLYRLKADAQDALGDYSGARMSLITGSRMRMLLVKKDDGEFISSDPRYLAKLIDDRKHSRVQLKGENYTVQGVQDQFGNVGYALVDVSENGREFDPNELGNYVLSDAHDIKGVNPYHDIPAWADIGLRKYDKHLAGQLEIKQEARKAAHEKVPPDLQSVTENIEAEAGLLRALGKDEAAKTLEVDAKKYRAELTLQQSISEAEALAEKGDIDDEALFLFPFQKDASGLSKNNLSDFVSVTQEGGNSQLVFKDKFHDLNPAKQQAVLTAVIQSADRMVLVRQLRQAEGANKGFVEGKIAYFDGDFEKAAGKIENFISEAKGSEDPATKRLLGEAEKLQKFLKEGTQKPPDVVMDDVKVLLGAMMPPQFQDPQGQLDSTKFSGENFKTFDEFREFLATQASVDGKSFNQTDFTGYHSILRNEKYEPILRRLYAEVNPEAAGEISKSAEGNFNSLYHQFNAEIANVDYARFAGQHLATVEGRKKLRRMLDPQHPDSRHYDKAFKADLLEELIDAADTKGHVPIHLRIRFEKELMTDMIDFNVTHENVRKATHIVMQILDIADRSEAAQSTHHEKYLKHPEEIAILQGGGLNEPITPEKLRQVAQLYGDLRGKSDGRSQMRSKLANMWLLVADNDNWTVEKNKKSTGVSPAQRAFMINQLENFMKRAETIQTNDDMVAFNGELHDFLKGPVRRNIDLEGDRAVNALKEFQHQATKKLLGDSFTIGEDVHDLFENLAAGPQEQFTDLYRFSEEIWATVDMGDTIDVLDPDLKIQDPNLRENVTDVIQGLRSMKRGLWASYKGNGWFYKTTKGNFDVENIHNASVEIEGIIAGLQGARTPEEVQKQLEAMTHAFKEGGALHEARVATDNSAWKVSLDFVQIAAEIALTEIVTAGAGTGLAIARATAAGGRYVLATKSLAAGIEVYRTTRNAQKVAKLVGAATKVGRLGRVKEALGLAKRARDTAGLAETAEGIARLERLALQAAKAGNPTQAQKFLRAAEHLEQASLRTEMQLVGSVAEVRNARRLTQLAEKGDLHAKAQLFASRMVQGGMTGFKMQVTGNVMSMGTGQLKGEPYELEDMLKQALATSASMALTGPFEHWGSFSKQATQASKLLNNRTLMTRLYQDYLKRGALFVGTKTKEFPGTLFKEVTEEVIDSYIQKYLNGDPLKLSHEEFEELLKACATGQGHAEGRTMVHMAGGFMWRGLSRGRSQRSSDTSTEAPASPTVTPPKTGSPYRTPGQVVDDGMGVLPPLGKTDTAKAKDESAPASAPDQSPLDKKDEPSGKGPSPQGPGATLKLRPTDAMEGPQEPGLVKVGQGKSVSGAAKPPTLTQALQKAREIFSQFGLPAEGELSAKQIKSASRKWIAKNHPDKKNFTPGSPEYIQANRALNEVNALTALMLKHEAGVTLKAADTQLAQTYLDGKMDLPTETPATAPVQPGQDARAETKVEALPPQGSEPKVTEARPQVPRPDMSPEGRVRAQAHQAEAAIAKAEAMAARPKVPRPDTSPAARARTQAFQAAQAQAKAEAEAAQPQVPRPDISPEARARAQAYREARAEAQLEGKAKVPRPAAQVDAGPMQKMAASQRVVFESFSAGAHVNAAGNFIAADPQVAPRPATPLERQAFTQWQAPVLTDSQGYPLLDAAGHPAVLDFSRGRKPTIGKKGRVKIDTEGVENLHATLEKSTRTSARGEQTTYRIKPRRLSKTQAAPVYVWNAGAGKWISVAASQGMSFQPGRYFWIGPKGAANLVAEGQGLGPDGMVLPAGGTVLGLSPSLSQAWAQTKTEAEQAAEEKVSEEVAPEASSEMGQGEQDQQSDSEEQESGRQGAAGLRVIAGGKQDTEAIGEFLTEFDLTQDAAFMVEMGRLTEERSQDAIRETRGILGLLHSVLDAFHNHLQKTPGLDAGRAHELFQDLVRSVMDGSINEGQAQILAQAIEFPGHLTQLNMSLGLNTEAMIESLLKDPEAFTQKLLPLLQQRPEIPQALKNEVYYLVDTTTPFAAAAQELLAGHISPAEYQVRQNEISKGLIRDHEGPLAVIRDLLDSLSKQPEFNIQEIQSRPKSSDSLIFKLMDRGWKDLKAFTDFGGARVIFSSFFNKDQFSTTAFIRHIKNEKTISFRAVYDGEGNPMTDTSGTILRDWDQFARYLQGHPKRGHRAIHLVVEVEGRPIEIQLMTHFQDQWGKIQHQFYKQREGLKEDEIKQIDGFFKDAADFLNDYEIGANYTADGVPLPPIMSADTNHKFQSLFDDMVTLMTDQIPGFEKSPWATAALLDARKRHGNKLKGLLPQMKAAPSPQPAAPVPAKGKTSRDDKTQIEGLRGKDPAKEVDADKTAVTLKPGVPVTGKVELPTKSNEIKVKQFLPFIIDGNHGDLTPAVEQFFQRNSSLYPDSTSRQELLESLSSKRLIFTVDGEGLLNLESTDSVNQRRKLGLEIFSKHAAHDLRRLPEARQKILFHAVILRLNRMARATDSEVREEMTNLFRAYGKMSAAVRVLPLAVRQDFSVKFLRGDTKFENIEALGQRYAKLISQLEAWGMKNASVRVGESYASGIFKKSRSAVETLETYLDEMEPIMAALIPVLDSLPRAEGIQQKLTMVERVFAKEMVLTTAFEIALALTVGRALADTKKLDALLKARLQEYTDARKASYERSKAALALSGDGFRYGHIELLQLDAQNLLQESELWMARSRQALSDFRRNLEKEAHQSNQATQDLQTELVQQQVVFRFILESQVPGLRQELLSQAKALRAQAEVASPGEVEEVEVGRFDPDSQVKSIRFRPNVRSPSELISEAQQLEAIADRIGDFEKLSDDDLYGIMISHVPIADFSKLLSQKFHIDRLTKQVEAAQTEAKAKLASAKRPDESLQEDLAQLKQKADALVAEANEKIKERIVLQEQADALNMDDATMAAGKMHIRTYNILARAEMAPQASLVLSELAAHFFDDGLPMEAMVRLAQTFKGLTVEEQVGVLFDYFISRETVTSAATTGSKKSTKPDGLAKAPAAEEISTRVAGQTARTSVDGPTRVTGEGKKSEPVETTSVTRPIAKPESEAPIEAAEVLPEPLGPEALLEKLIEDALALKTPQPDPIEKSSSEAEGLAASTEAASDVMNRGAAYAMGAPALVASLGMIQGIDTGTSAALALLSALLTPMMGMAFSWVSNLLKSSRKKVEPRYPTEDDPLLVDDSGDQFLMYRFGAKQLEQRHAVPGDVGRILPDNVELLPGTREVSVFFTRRGFGEDDQIVENKSVLLVTLNEVEANRLGIFIDADGLGVNTDQLITDEIFILPIHETVDHLALEAARRVDSLVKLKSSAPNFAVEQVPAYGDPGKLSDLAMYDPRQNEALPDHPLNHVARVKAFEPALDSEGYLVTVEILDPVDPTLNYQAATESGGEFHPEKAQVLGTRRYRLTSSQLLGLGIPLLSEAASLANLGQSFFSIQDHPVKVDESNPVVIFKEDGASSPVIYRDKDLNPRKMPGIRLFQGRIDLNSVVWREDGWVEMDFYSQIPGQEFPTYIGSEEMRVEDAERLGVVRGVNGRVRIEDRGNVFLIGSLNSTAYTRAFYDPQLKDPERRYAFAKALVFWYDTDAGQQSLDPTWVESGRKFIDAFEKARDKGEVFQGRGMHPEFVNNLDTIRRRYVLEVNPLGINSAEPRYQLGFYDPRWGSELHGAEVFRVDRVGKGGMLGLVDESGNEKMVSSGSWFSEHPFQVGDMVRLHDTHVDLFSEGLGEFKPTEKSPLTDSWLPPSGAAFSAGGLGLLGLTMGVGWVAAAGLAVLVGGAAVASLSFLLGYMAAKGKLQAAGREMLGHTHQLMQDLQPNAQLIQPQHVQPQNVQPQLIQPRSIEGKLVLGQGDATMMWSPQLQGWMILDGTESAPSANGVFLRRGGQADWNRLEPNQWTVLYHQDSLGINGQEFFFDANQMVWPAFQERQETQAQVDTTTQPIPPEAAYEAEPTSGVFTRKLDEEITLPGTATAEQLGRNRVNQNGAMFSVGAPAGIFMGLSAHGVSPGWAFLAAAASAMFSSSLLGMIWRGPKFNEPGVAAKLSPPPGKNQFVLGRSEDADIRFESAAVSRKHATFYFDVTRQTWLLKDGTVERPSHNGILIQVGGKGAITRPDPNQWHAVQDGDVIYLGEERFTFDSTPAPVAADPIAAQAVQEIDYRQISEAYIGVAKDYYLSILQEPDINYDLLALTRRESQVTPDQGDRFELAKALLYLIKTHYHLDLDFSGTASHEATSTGGIKFLLQPASKTTRLSPDRFLGTVLGAERLGENLVMVVSTPTGEQHTFSVPFALATPFKILLDSKNQVNIAAAPQILMTPMGSEIEPIIGAARKAAAAPLSQPVRDNRYHGETYLKQILDPLTQGWATNVKGDPTDPKWRDHREDWGGAAAVAHEGSGSKYQGYCEDRTDFVTLPDGRTVAVAIDGMGGHGGGEVAAAIAQKTFRLALEDGHTLEDALEIADHAISAHNKMQGKTKNVPGATAILVEMTPTGQGRYRGRFAKVADADALVIRPSLLAQGDGILDWTETPHILTPRFAEEDFPQFPQGPQGRMARRMTLYNRLNPYSNMIETQLGNGEVQPHIFEGQQEFQDGDIVILGSDGLHESFLNKDKIQEVVARALYSNQGRPKAKVIADALRLESLLRMWLYDKKRGDTELTREVYAEAYRAVMDQELPQDYRGLYEPFTDGQGNPVSFRLDRKGKVLRITPANPEGEMIDVFSQDNLSIVVQVLGEPVGALRPDWPQLPASAAVRPDHLQALAQLQMRDRAREQLLDSKGLGVAPVTRVDSGGHQFYLSRIIQVPDGRGGFRKYALALVPVQEDGAWVLKRRFFLKHQSDQGSWRASPYQLGGWISKGTGRHYTQETQIAPELMERIHQLESGNNSAELNFVTLSEAELGRYIEASALTEVTGVPEQSAMMSMIGGFEREVKFDSVIGMTQVGQYQPGKIFHTQLDFVGKKQEFDPELLAKLENLELPDGLVPEFDMASVQEGGNRIRTFKMFGEMIGEITCHEFSGGYVLDKATGRQRPLIWTMAEDSQGRTWVKSIRYVNSKITSYGTYEDVLDSGILTAKPLEYYEQAHHLYRFGEGYALPVMGRDGKLHDRYVDISPTLGLLEPIKKYRQARGLPPIQPKDHVTASKPQAPVAAPVAPQPAIQPHGLQVIDGPAPAVKVPQISGFSHVCPSEWLYRLPRQTTHMPLKSLLPENRSVSQVHGEIYRKGGRVWIRDLGSTNGTQVFREGQEQPVYEHRRKGQAGQVFPLEKGDMILIGEEWIHLDWEDEL